MKKEFLRRIPKIDEVLMDERLFVFFGEVGREVAAEKARETIDALRHQILTAQDGEEPEKDKDQLIEEIATKIREISQNNLRRTINATGIALHTNLGRAKLSQKACESVMEVAANYSNLEYDIKKGARGSRYDHVEKLITKITGAEAAMVVNNNAAATMLCLAALAKEKEVVVSRGELVEIGGSFRVPDIMAESGSILVEVGATNKTKLTDYENAINECTGALLKVHTSNYKIIGFTAEVPLSELAELGKIHGIPVIYDMGSGLIVSLKDYGIDEPTVLESLGTGIDLILFSGDKLLGGPQAGILAGKKKLIDRMKKHPLARVLRVDKMVLAALETTFKTYGDRERALKEIPVLSMLTASEKNLKSRAEAFAENLKKTIAEAVAPVDENAQRGPVEWLRSLEISVEAATGQVGGGSAPGVTLEGWGVTVSGKGLPLDKIERELRRFRIPIIARIFNEKIYFDMRTISVEEESLIAEGIGCAIEKIGERANE